MNKKIIAVLTAVLISISSIGITAFAADQSGEFKFILVTAADNTDIPYDIYGYVKSADKAIYLFLPSRADLSSITFWKLNPTSSRRETKVTVNFTDGDTADETYYTGLENYSIIPMQSKLPSLYLDINESYGSISNMNNSSGHSVHCYGDFRLDVSDELAEKNGWETSYVSTENDSTVSGTMDIRGRGNWTWSRSKKPYQFKLEKKLDLLGMGKAKTWTLLANDLDKSLMRNEIFYNISKKIGLEYTPDIQPVDVYMNNKYLGTYDLAEKVEVKENRVELDELNDYLVEVDNYTDTYTFKTNKNLQITLKEPETDTAFASIKSIMNNIEAQIVDTSTENYRFAIDEESFAKMFWIQDFCMNFDVMFGSQNMYYISSESKLYCGPVWDLDNSCGVSGQFDNTSPNHWHASTVRTGSNWFYYLRRHKSFRDELSRQYYQCGIRDAFAAAADDVEKMYEYIKESADMNYIRWDNLTSHHFEDTHIKTTIYRDEVDFLKNFVTVRYNFYETDGNIGRVGFGGGNGTKSSPYIIENEVDFNQFTNDVLQGNTYSGTYFIQNTDIDMTKSTTYSGMGEKCKFSGYYDGNGHKIKVNFSGNDVSIFPYTNGTVINLITEGSMNNTTCASGVARSVRNGGKIINCASTASLAGGVLGGITISTEAGTTKIMNCWFAGAFLTPSVAGAMLPTQRSGLSLLNNFYLDTTAPATVNANTARVTDMQLKNDVCQLLNDNLPAVAAASGVSYSALCQWKNIEGKYPELIPKETEKQPVGLTIAKFSLEADTPDILVEKAMGNCDNGYKFTEGLYFSQARLFASINGKDMASLFYSDSLYSLNKKDTYVPVMAASSDEVWAGGGEFPYFEIRVPTSEFKNIALSAKLGASKKGPRDFSVKYSIDGKTYYSVVDDNAVYSIPGTKTMENAFSNVLLPESVSNKELVYIRISVYSDNTNDTLVTLTGSSGGEAAINDIIISGVPIDADKKFVAAPSSNIDNGKIFNDDYITLSNGSAEDIIKYTITNNSQTSAELTYSEPIHPFNGTASDFVEIKCWAENSGNKSLVNTYTYSYGGIAIAKFSYDKQPAATNGFAYASGGTYTNNSYLSASANGQNKIIPVYKDNGLSISPDDGVYFEKGGYWLIEMPTSGFYDITLNANACSSKKGPAYVDVLYSVDGKSYTLLEKTKKLSASKSGVFFDNYKLPYELDNKSTVFIKLEMNDDVRADRTDTNALFGVESAGNTYISDLTICGKKYESVPQMPYTEFVGEGFSDTDKINLISPDKLPVYYSISRENGDLISADILYKEPIKLNNFISPSNTAFIVKAWCKNGDQKSNIWSKTFSYIGEPLALFNISSVADGLTSVDATYMKEPAVTNDLKMSPDGKSFAALSYDGSLSAIKASATDSVTWTHSSDGDNDGYWLIQSRTYGYTQIKMRFSQASDEYGPREFKVMYSLDNLNFIPVENVKVSVSEELNMNCVDVSVPSIVENKRAAYFKIAIDSGENVLGYELNDPDNGIGKGSTYINNIELYGTRRTGSTFERVIQDVTKNESTVNVSLKNILSTTISADVYVALYKKGKMKELSIKPLNLAAARTSSLSFDTQVIDYDTVKVFVLDDFMPVCKAYDSQKGY